MFKTTYELSDEPLDLKKCTKCGEKPEGGCIPLGPLCGKCAKEWNDMVLKICWSKENVESN